MMNSASSAPGMGREKRFPFLIPLLAVCVLVPLCFSTDSLLLFTLASSVVGGMWGVLWAWDRGRFRALRVFLPLLLFPVLAGLVTRSAEGVLLSLLLFAPALTELLYRTGRLRLNTAYALSSFVMLGLLTAAGIILLRSGGYALSPAGIREAIDPQVSVFIKWVNTLEGEMLGQKVALFPAGQIEGLVNYLLGLLPGFAVLWSLTVSWAASLLCRWAEVRFGYTEKRAVRAIRMSLFSALLAAGCCIGLLLAEESTPSLVELVCSNLILCLLPGFALSGIASLFRRLKRGGGVLSMLLLFLLPLYVLFDPISSAVFCAAFGVLSTIFRRVRLALRVLMSGSRDGED